MDDASDRPRVRARVVEDARGLPTGAAVRRPREPGLLDVRACVDLPLVARVDPGRRQEAIPDYLARVRSMPDR